LALLAALAVPVPAASSSFVNWPSYLNGVSHHSYAAQATAITPSNAASLTEAWHFMPGAPAGEGPRLCAQRQPDGV
jgi:hypothetical protein